MRLICPNCGAQYDVPVEVIPDGGRDVQCSNCGHTWYQRHPDQDVELAEELNQPVPDPEWTPESEAEDTPTAPIPPAERPSLKPPQAPVDQAAADADAETAQVSPNDTPDDQPEAKPRSIDPEMAEIFREEREYEARQRAAETLESQPDLGLQDPDEDEQARRSRQARERMARMRGEDADVTPRPAPRRPAPPPIPEPETVADEESRLAAETAAAAAAASSRRDLLPDVDEINQTLRATSEPRAIDNAERAANIETPQKSGFGKGFLTSVVVIGLAIGAYVLAPKISETVPAAAPALEAYTTKVDSLRLWLDDQVTQLMVMLDGMSSEAAPTTSDTSVAPDSGREAAAEPEADPASE